MSHETKNITKFGDMCFIIITLEFFHDTFACHKKPTNENVSE